MPAAGPLIPVKAAGIGGGNAAIASRTITPRFGPGGYLLPGIMVYNSSRNNRRRQAGVAQW